MSLFRDFLYCDDRTVDSYLSVIEGGLFDEEDRHTTLDSSGVTPSGHEVAPNGLSSSDSRRKTVRQTSAARFGRLLRYMMDEGEVNHVRAGEALALEAVEEESFFQVRGDIQISPLVSAMMNADKYQLIGNVVRQISHLGLAGNVDVGEEFFDMVTLIGEAREAIGDKVSVVMHPGSGAPPFVLPIRAGLIGGRFNELEGRSTVFGKVSDIVPRKGEYTLLEVPGQPALTRRQRRQAAKAEADLAVVRGPLVVLQVLAVYR
ncbi:DUF6414 family protein [Saccharothrix australiensis]|uniref:Uncharacterized protein n=1 Tax=Saccharothrix australiensis TaxID=2072 RepID=A0A495W7A2_9PSEU|nr:hypothetical protein [Saccharothrix australiensis]RKT57621.1 hypothetical protein C8E97_6345 [Saccharothrix australiensis]